MALRELDAKPFVATKIALSLTDLDDIPGAVTRSVEASIERLGLARLALVQLHNRVGAARAAKADIGVGALLTVDDVLGADGWCRPCSACARAGWSNISAAALMAARRQRSIG